MPPSGRDGGEVLSSFMLNVYLRPRGPFFVFPFACGKRDPLYFRLRPYVVRRAAPWHLRLPVLLSPESNRRPVPPHGPAIVPDAHVWAFSTVGYCRGWSSEKIIPSVLFISCFIVPLIFKFFVFVVITLNIFPTCNKTLPVPGSNLKPRPEKRKICYWNQSLFVRLWALYI